MRVEVIEALCDVDQLIEVKAVYPGGSKRGSQERPGLFVGSI